MTLTPTIKDKKVILNHHLHYEREYAIESIPAKAYKKDLVFLVARQ